MKKFMSFLLSALLVLSLAACESNGGAGSNDSESSVSSTASSEAESSATSQRGTRSRNPIPLHLSFKLQPISERLAAVYAACRAFFLFSEILAQEFSTNTLTNRAKKRMLIYRVISNLERSACR